jgi:hypothetical protein
MRCHRPVTPQSEVAKRTGFFDLILQCAKGLLGVDLRSGDVVVAEDGRQPDEIVAGFLKVIIAESMAQDMRRHPLQLGPDRMFADDTANRIFA